MTLPAGIHDRVAAEVYHADPAPEPSLSASIAKLLTARSPAHAWTAHPRLNPDFVVEQKDIFDLGSAAHNMVLRQDYWREEIDIIDAADWRTKAAREAKEHARANGLYPLLRTQYDALEAMVSALENHPHASRIFREGKPEQTLVWHDAKRDIWLRCRPDWAPESGNPWPDYKTTQDANPETWDRRFCLDQGGLLRSAFYAEGIRRVCDVRDPVMYYVVQEVAPPYSVVVRVMDPDLLHLGRSMFLRACDLWAECVHSDTWPSYPLLGTISIPEWAATKLETEYST